MKAAATELIGQGGALWGRVNAFNFVVSRLAHESRLPTLPPGVLAAVQQSPRGSRRLSRQLLSEGGQGTTAPCFDFRDPAWRLALLDHDLVERLIVHAGIAVHAPGLSRIIDGSRRREVRSAVGDAMLTFAVQRALFFHKPPQELRRRFPGLPETLADAAEAIRRAGHESIALCLAGAPREIFQRVALLFPGGTPLDAGRAVDPELRAQVFAFLRRLLVLEILPDSGTWLS